MRTTLFSLLFLAACSVDPRAGMIEAYEQQHTVFPVKVLQIEDLAPITAADSARMHLEYVNSIVSNRRANEKRYANDPYVVPISAYVPPYTGTLLEKAWAEHERYAAMPETVFHRRIRVTIRVVEPITGERVKVQRVYVLDGDGGAVVGEE